MLLTNDQIHPHLFDEDFLCRVPNARDWFQYILGHGSEILHFG